MRIVKLGLFVTAIALLRYACNIPIGWSSPRYWALVGGVMAIFLWHHAEGHR